VRYAVARVVAVPRFPNVFPNLFPNVFAEVFPEVFPVATAGRLADPRGMPEDRAAG
jgi:hypothetical protein